VFCFVIGVNWFSVCFLMYCRIVPPAIFAITLITNPTKVFA